MIDVLFVFIFIGLFAVAIAVLPVLIHNNFVTQWTAILNVQPLPQTYTVEIMLATCNFG